MPNLALASTLKTRLKDLDILYIGSRKGMEAELVKKAGLKFRAISCGKLRRYFSLQNISDIFKTLAGIWESFWIVRRFKPAVIFAKGGYVSFPVAVAGWLNHVPVLTHESDTSPGLANKLNARFSTKILVSFEKTLKFFKPGKAIFTGSPVREELREGERKVGLSLCKLDGKKTIMLVTGGGLGASFLNEWIWTNLDALLEKLEIIHLCGAGKLHEVLNRPGYFQTEFADTEMKDLYAATDVVLGRAGANSLFELEYLGIPGILIPLTRGSRGDQVDNAKEFAKKHPALILTEDELSSIKVDDFGSTAIKLAEQKKTIKKDPSGNQAIVDLILKYDKKA